jgi:hypothetical protein
MYRFFAFFGSDIRLRPRLCSSRHQASGPLGLPSNERPSSRSGPLGPRSNERPSAWVPSPSAHDAPNGLRMRNAQLRPIANTPAQPTKRHKCGGGIPFFHKNCCVPQGPTKPLPFCDNAGFKIYLTSWRDASEKQFTNSYRFGPATQLRSVLGFFVPTSAARLRSRNWGFMIVHSFLRCTCSSK